MAKISKEEAKRFLADVAAEKSFWVHGGAILKNMQQLADALKSMPEETFNYHVNNEKNDFANWVNDVIGDTSLANSLRTAKSRQSAFEKVKTRLINLKKIVS